MKQGIKSIEKLYEELLIKTEELSKTENNLIFIEHDTPRTRDEMEAIVAELKEVCMNHTEIGSDAIKEVLHKMVPTYYTPEEINKKAESTQEMKAAAKV